jgi:hypothetical protein
VIGSGHQDAEKKPLNQRAKGKRQQNQSEALQPFTDLIAHFARTSLALRSLAFSSSLQFRPGNSREILGCFFQIDLVQPFSSLALSRATVSSEMFFESFPLDGKATCKAHWVYGLYRR